MSPVMNPLLFCSDLIDIREKYFDVDLLKMLFGYHLQLFEKDEYCLKKFLVKNMRLFLILNYLIA